MAPYILSPDPASILHVELNPYSLTSSLEIFPILSVELETGGSLDSKSLDMILVKFSDHLFFTGSQSPVPEASPSSIANTPPVKK